MPHTFFAGEIYRRKNTEDYYMAIRNVELKNSCLHQALHLNSGEMRYIGVFNNFLDAFERVA